MAPIPGYEGVYAVDETGLVWRVGAPRGTPLTPVLVGGYLRVVLSKSGQKRPFLVHQLVLLAFEGPCPAGMECRHLNGVRTDNRHENLRYGTPFQNAADRDRHGRTPRGSQHYRAILTEEQVVEIRRASRGVYALGASFGVSRATVEAIRARRIWRHIGG